MLGQHALAVRVEVFGDVADALFLQIVGGREREGIEALWSLFYRGLSL